MYNVLVKVREDCSASFHVHDPFLLDFINLCISDEYAVTVVSHYNADDDDFMIDK